MYCFWYRIGIIMKVIVAGTRTINDADLVEQALLDSGFEVDELVSGGASGVDTIIIDFAKTNNIPYKVFPAEWDYYGKSAGPRRNAEMAKYADALVLVWDGQSRGSWNMRDQMEKLNKPVFEILV